VLAAARRGCVAGTCAAHPGARLCILHFVPVLDERNRHDFPRGKNLEDWGEWACVSAVYTCGPHMLQWSFATGKGFASSIHMDSYLLSTSSVSTFTRRSFGLFLFLFSLRLYRCLPNAQLRPGFAKGFAKVG